MRELQSGREPWQLAKELVSNAWDESINRCVVELKSTGTRRAKLVVEDDGNGFSDIKDAWTLMAHTPKRGNPNVRGRFNIGEKEILSVAKSAKIFTNGHVIIFPKSGGRQIRKTEHMKGARIECVLAWGNRQVDSTVEKLKQLLVPSDIEYLVNGEKIEYMKPTKIIEATLETTIQNSPSEPMRQTWRKTNVELIPSENGMLYEMGIPIQTIQCPYLVNVMQKVPMPPNRDVVKDSYLQDIYTAILNNTAEELSEEKSSETWVREAIEDKDINLEVAKEVMAKRYGEKVMLWSTDRVANERALEHGFEVIHGKTLSEAERQVFQSVGLCHTSDKFSLQPSESEIINPEDWTKGMINVARYTKYLGRKLLNNEIGIQIYKQPSGYAKATWHDGIIGFNLSHLTNTFFDAITTEVTALILHELAHQQGNGHDSLYLDSLKELAGKAVHLAVWDTEMLDFVPFGS
uniref:Putative GHKL domain containing protein n=1 Tax=viral metagenome TaxID=1070528 RepID=A0A6M3LKV0_9ZZZZ